MTIETRNLPAPIIEFRADADSKTAAGLAAPFGGDSHDFGDWKERIKPGAFKRSLKLVEKGEHRVELLWAHDMSQPLGSTKSGKLSLNEDERGLNFEADTSRFTPLMLSALEDGDLGVSIGFRVVKDTWEKVDGDARVEYIRTLEDVDLLEISLLVNPAYPQTDAAKRSLDAFKEEFREIDNIDTNEQLRRIQYLQARLRLR